MPMKETEGTLGDARLSERKCPACQQHNVIKQVWESNCGGFEDLKFTCTTDGCGKVWWIDGSDS